VKLFHLVLQFVQLPGSARTCNSNYFPEVLDKLLQSVLTRMPLMILLALLRRRWIHSQHLSQVRIELFINQIHNKLSPIPWTLIY
jgi:hypothetical protein